MVYRICDTERKHWYRIIMDYDHKKAVKLSDVINADPRFSFYAYYSRKDIGLHVISVYVPATSPLHSESNEYVKDELLTICASLLGANPLQYAQAISQ